MSDKEKIIEVVKSLPDDATLERIQEEIDILIAIQRGRDDIKAGRVLSHDEVIREMKSWTTP
jgi:predicted transcriptional regulator